MKINALLQALVLIVGGVSIHAQTTEAWVRRYNGKIDSTDVATSVAVDRAGNVIVAGATDDAVPSSNWLIIKYSPAGMPLWTNRFDGPTNTSTGAAAIAVGSNGTIFVTGTTLSTGTFYSSDYTTVAFSEAGIPLWTNRYDGPEHNADQPVAMTVAQNGNVFVTGISYAHINANTIAQDYATVAYSESGIPLWTNRYNGPGNSIDKVYGVAVSPNGTVYVTGESDGGSSLTDFATIAYSNTGVPLWTNCYNGPANEPEHSADLTVGADGTVFVCGYSGNGHTNGYDFDFATVAYAETGAPLWTNRYHGGPKNYPEHAPALAVGSDGSVFVTGYEFNGGSDDFTTLAYSSAGVLLWTNRYNGPAGAADQPTALQIDADGTVFVAGFSSSVTSSNYATLAYSSAGIPLWTNLSDGLNPTYYPNASLAVGPNHTVVIAGTSKGTTASDAEVIAFSDSGALLWTNRFTGLANKADQVYAMAVGSEGTIFVTGKSLGTTNTPGYSTIAYSGSGVPLWTNHIDGLPPGDTTTYDPGVMLAVGSDGTVAVSGIRTRTNFATVAYSSTGAILWTNFNSGPGSISSVSGVAVSSNGTVFVSGYYTIKPGRIYRTMAISTTGETLWNIAAGDTFMRLDSCGNILLTGWGWTRAYSQGGVALWTNRCDGLTDSSLALAPNGNIINSGTISNDFGTLACSNTGLPLWTNRYNGPGNSNDAAVAVAVSPSGKVFVTGSSRTGSFYEYATVAYSGMGVPLWTNRYGELGVSCMAQAVGVNSNGTVFVTGYTGDSSSKDFVTIVYSEAGVPLSTNRYDGPANGNDVIPRYALVSVSDGVVVAGSSDISRGARTVSDFAVVKYLVPSISSLEAGTGAPPATITLLHSGDAQLAFYGTAGSSYVLEHTFDLGSNSWTPVQTNTADGNGAVPFTYLPFGPVNFWRIRPLP